MVSRENAMLGGGLVLLIAAAWIVTKFQNMSAKDMASSIAEGTVGAVAGAVTGVIAGVSDSLGIPRTSDVINWANSTDNPLQPIGKKIGGTIYDAFN